MRHHHPRQLGKKNCFSWSRSLRDNMVAWHLFRRDQTGKVHYTQERMSVLDTRTMAAMRLRQARHALRDQVDRIDLALMRVIH